MIRNLKIALAVLVALWGFFGGIGNLTEISKGYGEVAATLSMEGTTDGAGQWRAISHPIVIWIGFAFIFLSKLAAGALCAYGSWQMWQARGAAASMFNAAKKPAVLGCGVALIMLIGGFIVVADTWFSLWQSDLGNRSLPIAFRYAACIGIIMLFLNQEDH